TAPLSTLSLHDALPIYRRIVQGHATNATIFGQGAGLRLDLLGGEDTRHRGEQLVAVEQLDVTGQLLDSVDVPAALDLHSDGRPRRVLGENVHWPDRGRVFATYQ